MSKWDGKFVVVGGGIAGIVAALRGAAAGYRVTLVEKQSRLGGLLTSTRFGLDEWFDCGTHLPASTGDAELDEVLFGGCTDADWQILPLVKAANFWNGKLNAESPCLDLRTLAECQYRELLPGLLQSATTSRSEPGTLAEQLIDLYGEPMQQRVFEPILEKFYGIGARKLAPDAHLLFGLIRFICLDAERVRELKRNPVLDRKLAFHSYRENPAQIAHARTYYPRSGGVGRWIDALTHKLAEAEVEVLLDRRISAIDQDANRATLSDGSRLEYDSLAWTLPGSLLLRAIGHPATVTDGPPRLATSTLHHFLVTELPVTDAHYVTCYDPALRSFRVTLYDNLQSAEPRRNSRVTVEVLTAQPGSVKPDSNLIWQEVTRMGLFSEGVRLHSAHVQELGGAFPILTSEYRRSVQTAADLIARDCGDIHLVGRAAGQSFFMSDTLRDAWHATASFLRAARVGVPAAP